MATGQNGKAWGAALLLLCAGGCLSGRGALDRALLADRDPAAHGVDPVAHYVVHCPDVLELEVEGSRGWKARCPVGADGRIDLSDAGAPRVEGLKLASARERVAQAVNVPAKQVHLQVAEFNSQHVYLIGEVQGQEQAVPYCGPETVLDVLQRVGGLSRDAAPREIKVVRPNIADGGTPE